jgi:hypothetical protein
LLSNLILGGGCALIFLLPTWLRGRKTQRGLALKSLKLRLVLYGLGFVAGEVYLMVLFADLKWPRSLLFVAITSWGVLLGAGAWYRDHRRRGVS